MELIEVAADEDLIKAGDQFHAAYIIKNGEVEVFRDGRVVEVLGRGDFCCELFRLQKESPASVTFRTVTRCDVYRVRREALVNYIARFPGVYMRLNYVYGN